MYQYKSIVITHKSASLDTVGKFVISDADIEHTLKELQQKLELDELLYLATCNRVEFFFVNDIRIDKDFLYKLLKLLQPDCSDKEINIYLSKLITYEGKPALEHLFKVASSLDSMIVGEREILRQLRTAYEKCRELNLTGDLLRIAVDEAIRTAKQIYTDTKIGEKQVSVVSLAVQQLLNLKLDTNANILMIGAGVTNTLMAKLLLKHGFSRFSLFNRSIEKAKVLGDKLNTEAQRLSELKNHRERFDILITCTAASAPIITSDIYTSLLNRDDSRKVIIDLAVPADVEESVIKNNSVEYVSVPELQKIADKNMLYRKNELTQSDKIIQEHLSDFEKLYKERMVVNIMSDVPNKVKAVKEKALNLVFSKDIQDLDAHSKEVLDKVIDYMEKKYVSIPMVIAKEKLVDNIP